MIGLSYFLNVVLYALFTLLSLLLFFIENYPIVLIVEFVTISLKQILEHVSHRSVVRALVKSQISTLTQIFCELNRVALA